MLALKITLIVVGVIAIGGGVILGALSLLGAGMSDNSQASSEVFSEVTVPCGIVAVFGIVLLIAAHFVGD